MLETYFGSPKMVAHLRAGPSGQFMDGFAGSLERSGYDPSVAVRYLRAAAHIGHFTLEQGGTLANVDLSAFSYHLRTCRCPRPKGGGVATIIRFTAPSVTANTWWQSASASAVSRQELRMLITRRPTLRLHASRKICGFALEAQYQCIAAAIGQDVPEVGALHRHAAD
jgi:hypothetical protein